jgi:hypothetical protein
MARCPHCEAEIAMLGIDDEASQASLATVHICPSCEAVLGVTEASENGDDTDPGVTR